MSPFKVWIEIEEIDDNGDNPQDGPLCLPDCVGEFDTEDEALARMWEISQQYCGDPENSDAKPKGGL